MKKSILFLTFLLFLISFNVVAQEEGGEKPAKQDWQKYRNQNDSIPKGPRGEGKRPQGRPQGEFTAEQWRQFADQMPKIGKVSGKVFEETSGKPLAYASVGLLLALDSSFVDGTITDEKGYFVMEELPVGRFIVSVEYMGLETAYVPDIRINPRRSPEVYLEDIKMTQSAEIIEGVVIEEKREFMELQLDKKVFNVSDNITVSGGTATDVLEQIPSVEVDVDGNVSLRGSQNLTILIDGRPSAITGNDPAAILEQIPSETIDKIEVITNPSAKYNPDGMSGILNIVLKKNKKLGLNGLLTLTWLPSELDEYGASLNLGYKNSKVNIYGNYSYRDNESEFSRLSDRTTFLTDTIYSFSLDGLGKRRRRSHNIKTGLDIYTSPSSVIFTSASFRFNKGIDETNNYYKYFHGNQYETPNHFGWIHEDELEPETSQNYNLGFQKRFKNSWDHTLDIDLNYSENNEEETANIQNGLYTTTDYVEENLMEDLYLQTDISNGKRKVLQGQIDYQNTFGNKSKLELGHQTIYRITDTDFNSTFDGYDNHFIFEEQIYSVYSTYGYPITESFSIKGGLRLEQAVTDGELIDTNEKFDKNYFSFFPSLTLSQTLKKGDQLSLSYSRRINRPRGRQINPFVSFADPLNLRRGNPDLNPEYTNAVELNYMKRWDKLTMMPSLYYRYTTGIINRFTTVDNEGVSTSSYINLSNGHAYGLEMSMFYTPFKWWRIMPSFNLTQTILDSSNVGADLNNNNFSFGGRLSNNMTVWKNLDLQIFTFFRAPSQTLQGKMKGMIMMTFGAKKKILNDKGSLGLNVRDPFSIGKFKFIGDTPTFYSVFEGQREPQVVTLTFTYRFGKQERSRNRGQRGDRDGGGMDGGFDDMMD